MKHIKLFNEDSEYQEYLASDSVFPNVSHCIDEDHVHYNPVDPDPYRGHEYVEIGGLKWATMNVGAESPTDWGQYFAYGETIGYDNVDTKQYSWNDYKFTEDGGLTFTKYNTADGLTTLQPEDDAAHIIWGGKWRIPTIEEFQNFFNSVDVSFINGYDGTNIPGILCTDKQDSSKQIFFPQAGLFEDGAIIRNIGSYRYGSYPSSSVLENYQYTDEEIPKYSGFSTILWTQPQDAEHFSVYTDGGSLRKCGSPIRAVAD